MARSTGTVISSDNGHNTTNPSYNVWKHCSASDDRSQILSWLSPLEPRLQHREVQERRAGNIGEWLIQREEFKRWCGFGGESEGDNQVLFCYGDPGVGKTFISSLVVDWLCDRRGDTTAVACFYFDFEARKEQSAASMLGSLLRQMVSGKETIPEDISRAFHEQRKAIGGRGLQLGDIVKMLQAITPSHHSFICIDAVDECGGVQRAGLLDSLKQILEKSPRTRIFLTGRPHIRAEVEKGLDQRVVSVSISPTKDDIIRYLHNRMGKDETPDAMDESLEADILEKIPQNISGTFRLVSLNIEAILQEPTIYRRRERLSKIADGLGLGGAYGVTIERIKAQGGNKSRLGIQALMWMSHAKRPLTADELCHALAVDLGSTKFNENNIPSLSTLVVCCQGLITVDLEASTVKLIHFTLQEYLSSNPHIFGEPHTAMAEICLTYLKSKQAKAISADTSPISLNKSFLEYCSVFWGVHAKSGLSAHATSLALELFQEYDDHISTKLLLERVEHLRPLDIGTNFGQRFWFTGLHCASFFGIVDLVSALTGMECYDVNEGDFGGHTPLIWAACNGHSEVVKMLLGLEEVKPDAPNIWGNTPLAYAAANGHEEVVKILLERQDVDPNKPNHSGQTPLSQAACSGHEGVVNILLGREEVNPDKADCYGRRPLARAYENGHEGVVRILLGLKKVNLKEPNSSGQTALMSAAGHGHKRV